MLAFITLVSVACAMIRMGINPQGDLVTDQRGAIQDLFVHILQFAVPTVFGYMFAGAAAGLLVGQLWSGTSAGRWRGAAAGAWVTATGILILFPAGWLLTLLSAAYELMIWQIEKKRFRLRLHTDESDQRCDG